MKLRDAWYFMAGIAFLAMAKAKHSVEGYSTPKPFDVSDVERSIEYDERVVAGWLQGLEHYTGARANLEGKNVLELGPGSDLGVGILVLARGARQYSACDVHDLFSSTPLSFYDVLFAKLDHEGGAAVAALRAELQKSARREPSRLNYVVQPDFDLPTAVGAGTIDLVFSQAAFEHFDDIDDVIRQLSLVCRPGAQLVAEIDLKTHSRWIRDVDPNNIYRYPDFLYKAFRFRGIPNRMRPYQYREALQRYGWTEIQIIRAALVGPHQSTSGMAERFRTAPNQMEYLSIMLCATFRGARASKHREQAG